MNATYVIIGDEHPLCLVKLYGGVTVDQYGPVTTRPGARRVKRQYNGIPHVHRRPGGSTPSDKLYVTEIKNILNPAGMLKSSLVDDRYYLIYPSMVPGDISLTDLARV